MKSIHTLAAIAAGLSLSLSASAQEQATTASSTGSHRPIPQSDQMFRKSIWRQVDLREKQNKPMFSEGKEISRVILEAVKRGELQAYKNDSLTSTFTPQEVSANMSYADEAVKLSDEEKAAGFSQADLGGGGDDWGAPAPKKGSSCGQNRSSAEAGCQWQADEGQEAARLSTKPWPWPRRRQPLLRLTSTATRTCMRWKLRRI